MNCAAAIGADARLLAPHEVLALCPLYADVVGILGALLHPDDGYVAPTDVTMAMLKGARMRGARAAENAGVRRGRHPRQHSRPDADDS
jgi:dimethylglycine dehydrogenase